jgi:hypothetical protein
MEKVGQVFEKEKKWERQKLRGIKKSLLVKFS